MCWQEWTHHYVSIMPEWRLSFKLCFSLKRKQLKSSLAFKMSLMKEKPTNKTTNLPFHLSKLGGGSAACLLHCPEVQGRQGSQGQLGSPSCDPPPGAQPGEFQKPPAANVNSSALPRHGHCPASAGILGNVFHKLNQCRLTVLGSQIQIQTKFSHNLSLQG